MVVMMTRKSLRIATRQSPLALWQANYVKACLEKNPCWISGRTCPNGDKGDVILDTPLAKIEEKDSL